MITGATIIKLQLSAQGHPEYTAARAAAHPHLPRSGEFWQYYPQGGLSGGKPLPPEKRSKIAEKQLKRDGISPNPLEYFFEVLCILIFIFAVTYKKLGY